MIKNVIKVQKVLFCYNLFNEKGKFKYNCHAQMYGDIKQLGKMCEELSKKLNNARIYNQGMVKAFYMNLTGKEAYRKETYIRKGITKEQLLKEIK